MSATTPEGYQYAVTGDPAEIHTVSQNLAQSISGRGVPAFATKAAALAAYGTTPSGSARPVCWVEDRQGQLQWTGTKWIWLPQRNIVCDIYLSSPVNVPNGDPLTIMTMSTPYVLPPGNRRLYVTSSVLVKNSSPPSSGYNVLAHAYLNGTNMGIGDVDSWMIQGLPPGSDIGYGRLQAVWNPIVAGTTSFRVDIKSVTGVPFLDVLHRRLCVIDTGPCDD